MMVPLMLSMLGDNFSRQHILKYFSQKKGLDIMYLKLHEISKYNSGKLKKKSRICCLLSRVSTESGKF